MLKEAKSPERQKLQERCRGFKGPQWGRWEYGGVREMINSKFRKVGVGIKENSRRERRKDGLLLGKSSLVCKAEPVQGKSNPQGF